MSVTPLNIQDPVYVTGQSRNAFDRFWISKIQDERDLPFIYLLFQLTFTIVPAAVLLFTPLLQGWVWWVAAFAYWAYMFYMIGPYTLMLHNVSHNRFFRVEYDWANNYVPMFMAVFFGQTPTTYYGHHIGMHHPENNLWEDLSTTMPYKRDNWRHFAHYYLSFVAQGPYDVYKYLTGKERFVLAKNVKWGETLYFVGAVALAFVSLKAVLMVFLIPLLIIRFAMMSGNWGQHAFIGEDPASPYHNSITCINSAYNTRCFNDGYHIGHHLKPRMHWTEMPVEFQKNMDKYAENNAIIFEGIDFQIVWFHLMCNNYKALAKRFVNIGNRFSNDDEVINFLKSRLQPITA